MMTVLVTGRHGSGNIYRAIPTPSFLHGTATYVGAKRWCSLAYRAEQTT